MFLLLEVIKFLIFLFIGGNIALHDILFALPFPIFIQYPLNIFKFSTVDPSNILPKYPLNIYKLVIKLFTYNVVNIFKLIPVLNPLKTLQIFGYFKYKSPNIFFFSSDVYTLSSILYVH